MNSKYLILPALGFVSAIGLTGCYEMDTIPMDQYVTDGEKVAAVEANPEIAQAAITGITALFSNYMQVIDDDHSDFGFPSLMISSESRGIDLVSEVTGYNWYSPQVRFSDCASNSDTSLLTWSHAYRQIFACNAALKSLDPETTDPEIQFYLGQAHGFRAYDYFLLAQTYQFTYKGNEDKPCVMLVDETNEDEIAANGCGRSTVADTYAQILDDCNKAISFIETSGVKPEDVLDSKPKRFLSLAAAYGLRARVNLVMNNWSAAQSDAEAAIASFRGTPLSISAASVPGFGDISANNWMLGVAIATTDRVVTSGIINFPSHMGSLNYGYASVGAWRRVNINLYNYISLSDVRKGWFLNEDGVSLNLDEAQQAYCDANKIPAYTQVKFAPYQDVLGQSQNACDVPLMRIEEMYLIKAEAKAMGGDPAGGAADLVNFVKTYRDPKYSFAGGSAEDVQNEVWMQRRVELYGEGFSTFDLMRLKKPFDRRGAGYQADYTYYIEPDDPVLLLCIPEDEENGNKGFTSADNNDPAPQPTPVKTEE